MSDDGDDLSFDDDKAAREMVERWERADRERAATPKPNGKAKLPEGVTLEDFSAFMPMHTYIYHPTARCGRRPA